MLHHLPRPFLPFRRAGHGVLHRGIIEKFVACPVQFLGEPGGGFENAQISRSAPDKCFDAFEVEHRSRLAIMRIPDEGERWRRGLSAAGHQMCGQSGAIPALRTVAGGRVADRRVSPPRQLQCIPGDFGADADSCELAPVGINFTAGLSRCGSPGAERCLMFPGPGLRPSSRPTFLRCGQRRLLRDQGRGVCTAPWYWPDGVQGVCRR